MQSLQNQLRQTLTPVRLTAQQKDEIRKKMDETKNELNLKAGLAAWAEKNTIRPIDFAGKMGYTPAYAWSLMRGEAAVTVACLGQFVIRYGTQAADELLTLAGMPAGEAPQVSGEQEFRAELRSSETNTTSNPA